MASLLYLLGCITLSGLSIFEVKTKKHIERVQLYLTLLGAMFFCGTFASLVAFARMANGQYESIAGTGVMLLTGGTLFLVTRMTRRFAAVPSRRSVRG